MGLTCRSDPPVLVGAQTSNTEKSFSEVGLVGKPAFIGNAGKRSLSLFYQGNGAFYFYFPEIFTCRAAKVTGEIAGDGHRMQIQLC